MRFYEVDSAELCAAPPTSYSAAFVRTPGNIRSKVICFEMTISYLAPVANDTLVRLGLVWSRDGRWVGEDERPVRFVAGRGSNGDETLRGEFGDVYDYTPGVWTFVMTFDGERVTNGTFQTVASVTGTTGCGPNGVNPCPTAGPQPRFFFVPFR